MPTISFPDTPQSRSLIRLWEQQRQRRVTTQRILFTPTSNSTQPTVQQPTESIGTPLFAGNQRNDIPHTEPNFQAKISTQAVLPPIEVVEDLHDDQLITSQKMMDALTVNQMICGSTQNTMHTSQDIFDSVTGSICVPRSISEQKKVQAKSVAGFISRLKTNDKHIVFPTNEQGHALRRAVRKTLAEIDREYHVSQYPEFQAQLTLMMLHSIDQKTVSALLHRYLMCTTEEQIQTLEQECALHKKFTQTIDYDTPMELLPGYHRILGSELEFIRIATAILDHQAYLSNSRLQEQYKQAAKNYDNLNISRFKSVNEFDTEEEVRYQSVMNSAALASQPNPLHDLNRGLRILIGLPNHIKKVIEQYARKHSIPENCMDRQWVFEQLYNHENYKTPDFSWTNKSTSSRTICMQFQNRGKCSYGDQCKYSHDQGRSQDSSQPENQESSPLKAAAGEDDFDMIEIECTKNACMECEKKFTASKSWYETKGFSLPKSCKACRKFKNSQSNNGMSALLTAHGDEDSSTDSNDLDDEDYIQFMSYSMSV